MKKYFNCLFFLISTSFCILNSQSVFQQSVSINTVDQPANINCSMDIVSNQRVIKLPVVNSAAINMISDPVGGMLLYNSDDHQLQGYVEETIVVEPDTTYPYSNGSSNLFAFTVIIYTPTQSGKLTGISVGIGSTNSLPAHRLIISEMKPCGSVSNRAIQKSGVDVYTDYINLLPNVRNVYSLSTPLNVMAGTKYYIYSDPMTNNAGPRILWSDTGVQNIPTIGYINTAGVCSENTGDVDVKFIIETSPSGWVNLNE